MTLRSLVKNDADIVFKTLNTVEGFVVWVDTSSTVLIANQNYIDWVGYKCVDRLMGMKYEDTPCEGGEFADVWSKQDQEAVQSRKTCRFLTYLFGANSDDRTLIYGSRKPLFDDTGLFAGLVCEFSDVTNNPVINPLLWF